MADCSFFNFILWGVCGTIVCSFGFIGNALSFAAFMRDRRLPATILVQSLAFSDSALLLLVFTTDCIPYICDYTQTCVNIWTAWPYIRYIWVLTPMSHMCSIWFVVLVALNRFWAVCRAFHAGQVWTNRSTGLYVSIIVIIVVAFNIPRFFEYNIVQTTDAYNNTILVENRTNFGRQYSYMVIYKVMLVNILLILLPICILIVLTAAILRKLYINRRKSKTSARSAHDVTIVLVLVVMVTIVCQTPLAVFNFIRYSMQYGCGDSIYALDNVSKLLINVNSCLNFVLYCVFSPKFRKLLLSVVCCCCTGCNQAKGNNGVAIFDENVGGAKPDVNVAESRANGPNWNKNTKTDKVELIKANFSANSLTTQTNGEV